MLFVLPVIDYWPSYFFVFPDHYGLLAVTMWVLEYLTFYQGKLGHQGHDQSSQKRAISKITYWYCGLEHLYRQLVTTGPYPLEEIADISNTLECSPVVRRLLSDSSLTPFWILSDSSLTPFWLLSDSFLTPFWLLSDSFLTPLWLLSNSRRRIGLEPFWFIAKCKSLYRHRHCFLCECLSNLNGG